MPGAANFGDTALLPVLLKSESMFRDPALYANLKRKMPTLASIAGNQTVRFNSDMFDAEKQCRTYKLHWIEDSATSGLVDSADLSCVLPSGPKATSNTKSYNATKFKGYKFTVDELECNYVSYENVLAQKLLTAKAALREHLNIAAITFLNANASTTNDYAAGGTFVGNKKTYPSATWANLDDIMYRLNREVEFNDVFNPILINGDNLNQAAWTSKYKGTNGCCTDQMAMIDAFGAIDWDSRYLEQSLVGEKASFLFDANRVALLNDWKYSNTEPIEIDKKNATEVFSITDDMVSVKNGSGTMPIHYDVWRQQECYKDATTNVLRIRYNYFVSVRWEFVLAPSLDANKTGILKLVNA